MIAALLLSFFGAAAVLLAVAAVSPLSCVGEFSFSKSGRSGRVRLHWLHPRIATLSYDIGEGSMTLKIAGWTYRAPRARPADEEESPPPAGGSVHGKPAAPSSSQSESPAPGPAPEPPRDDGRGAFAGHTRETATPAAAAATHPEPRRGPSRQERAGQGFSLRKLRSGFAVLRKRRLAAKLLCWVLRTLRPCLGLIRFDRLRLHAAGGFDDPAETGKLYGWYCAAANGLFEKHNNVEIRYVPRFVDPGMECEGAVAVSTSLLRALAPLSVAILTFPYLSAFLAWRGLKNVQKRDMRRDKTAAPSMKGSYAGNA